jgi:type I restriction-modification system DNA methylase subunit
MVERDKGSEVARVNGNGGALGFETKLWQAADALRNNMDAAEYKHVVLGLIFLKYISDAFEAKHAELEAEKDQDADPEDPDEYRAAQIFWVPKEARWSFLKANAPQPTIGSLVDDAMAAICKAAKLEEIEKHGYVLTPGRYIGAAEVADDEVPFAEKFATLRAQLRGAIRGERQAGRCHS